MTVPPHMQGIFRKYLNPVNKVSCKILPIEKEVIICSSLGRLIIRFIPEYFLTTHPPYNCILLVMCSIRVVMIVGGVILYITGTSESNSHWGKYNIIFPFLNSGFLYRALGPPLKCVFALHYLII